MLTGKVFKLLLTRNFNLHEIPFSFSACFRIHRKLYFRLTSVIVRFVKMSYTLEQKFFIITTFIETKSQTVTVRKFKTRFQRETSRNYVKYLFEKLKAHGGVNNLPLKKKSKIEDEEFLNEIKNLLIGKVSLRRVAREAGISLTTCHKASKAIIKLHPYKLHILKELKHAEKNLNAFRVSKNFV